MVAPGLTRFVPSIAPPREAVVDDPASVEDVRAVVRVRDGAGATRELVVGTDASGAVKVLGSREGLGLEARGQLAFHEVASGGRAVEVDADEIWVFDLQTMEMLPDAPGLNDALYVYGLMHGPFPARVGQESRAVEGQLTVTRADLLGALVDGVSNAFAYAPDEHGSRCIHGLLPAERAEVIASGRGIVLALPLVPTWLLECPQSNDLVVAQLLYDVLVALRADLGGGANATPLPVPNRPALEHELVAAGWRIEGDEAVRPKGTGLIGSLRGNEKRKLPKQGTVVELAAEARTVLARMTAASVSTRANVLTPEGLAVTPEGLALTPEGLAATPEGLAIRRRTMRAPLPTPPVSAAIPRPSPQPSPTPPRATPRPLVAAADRTEWMKDFVDAHRTPSRPTPRVSTPARAVSKTATPEWMKDFDGPAKPDDE